MPKKVDSPCTDICQFSRANAVCVGCFRTRDEIARWKKLPDHKRRSILEASAARRRKAEAKGRI